MSSPAGELCIRVDAEAALKKIGVNSGSLKNHVQKITTTKEQPKNFPVDAFPAAVQQIINELFDKLNFPKDYSAGAFMFASSIAIGNSCRALVKRGFEQTAVIYIALVGRPGAMKSHPLAFALKPMQDMDTASYSFFEREILEYEKMLKQRRGKKSKENEEDEPPAAPIFKKFLISDFTPEAVASLHKFNPRGLGVYVDELFGWFKTFERYNKSNAAEMWLSNFNSSPLNIDRKGGKPAYIAHPFISVGGTVQTGILSELTKDNRTQNGFLDRILFVMPDDVAKPGWTSEDVEAVHIENWKNLISNLIAMDCNPDAPELIGFSQDAKDELFAWQKKNALECDQASEQIAGAYSKIEMLCVRFALILECLRYACSESDRTQIGIDSVRGAVKISEYFKDQAVRVREIIFDEDPLIKFPKNVRDFYNALPETFTTSDAAEIAEGFSIKPRTLKRLLQKTELFERVAHGQYKKNG